MQDAITKAAALVEAHEYIRRFEGKAVVVKVGGSIMDEPSQLASLIMDVCFMDAVGMKPVIVHGGGKSITEAMKKAGLEAQFVQGRCYTDERTLAIVEHVLVNEVNSQIVAEIKRLEHKGMGLHTLGSGVVFGKRLFPRSPGGERGGPAENRYRFRWRGGVGQRGIGCRAVGGGLHPRDRAGRADAAGGKLNINADSVAGHVAKAIHAEKLILVSDTHGIRTDEHAESFASTLTKARIEELTKKGIITAGMLPKVEASITARWRAACPGRHLLMAASRTR